MGEFSIRRSFGKNKSKLIASNLVEIQKNSYESFLQFGDYSKKRELTGLYAILKEVFEIGDDDKAKNQVEFISYSLDEPALSEEEAVKKDATYSTALKVKLRVIRYEGKGAERVVKEVKEQEVFFADIPLMTRNADFIINGSRRVIVSQLHKSAGVFFDCENTKAQGVKKSYAAHIVPYRGAWLDFEIDQKGICWIRIDKRRKLHLTSFLQVLGGCFEQNYTAESMLKTFYTFKEYSKAKFGWKVAFNEDDWAGERFAFDIINPSTGAVVVEATRKVNAKKVKELAEIGEVGISRESVIGFYVSKDIKVDGELLLSAGDEILEEHLEALEEVNSLEVFDIDNARIGGYLRDTLFADKNKDYEKSLLAFYKVMRPGEAASLEGAAGLFKSMFFDSDRYDLSSVGRVKMNARLKKFYDSAELNDSRILEFRDFIALIKGLMAVKDGRENVDDIDHLGLRRVRSVGELVANQFRAAVVKVVRSLKDRLNLVEAEDDINLHDLVNSRSLLSSLREFFGTSQLSQVMDNINSLSEISHKRRITAMGPGGLDALRATFEVRDVHPTHYGRICAIETPEGQNIGLINYLAMHARIDNYGFIQTPYRKVVDGVVTDEVVYLNAQEEEERAICAATVKMDKECKIQEELVACRLQGDYVVLPVSEVEFADVSSGQILSVAASLIPFIENDDPGRALMGSNMQRQAVPLKVPQAPFVGTGVEKQVGMDSMSVLRAMHDGVVVQMDASRVVIRRSDEVEKIDVYSLQKFQRSNSSTCLNQTPCVKNGDIVKAGDLIADGFSTENGEIALGTNLKVAFIPYKGLTFEDSIVISEKLLDDRLTSIHIEEFEISARETKNGAEEITREVPNVSEEFLRNLDEAGIIHLGAKVKPGDILVGRVVPKVEGPASPEERLLKAMFGEKAADVSDASLRVSAGIYGTVVDVHVFSKKGMEKDERSLMIERSDIKKISRDRDAEIASLVWSYRKTLNEILVGKKVSQDNALIPKGFAITEKLVADLDFEDLMSIELENESDNKAIALVSKEFRSAKKNIQKKFEKIVKDLQAGDDLAPGVLKTVKIFVAMHRTIEAGDKMAGRHGNKGVISRVLPVQDMPFDDNGDPVDIILSPLGVPARMNIGQILETHLGWVSSEIGKKVSKLLGQIYNQAKDMDSLRQMLKKIYPNNAQEIEGYSHEQMVEIGVKISKGVPFASPSFDGARIDEIRSLLKEWDLPESGQIRLRDGDSGEYFPEPITVGYMYIKKLNHMVADKIHARSTGSYSLVTQQPPGGRSKMGGQRKGEMEIWALQAYGAAYITLESTTVKSDDHAGRVAAYEAITQGYEVTNEVYSTPEAFKILQSEMRCIGINLECVAKGDSVDGTDEWISSQHNGKFDALRISLLSPESIKKMSFGEVSRPETMNYRTQKAEIDGLLCPAIFGPERDYKCACGRYSKMKYRGIVCERCNVEVTVSRVRRERMGHITLAAPVAHIWFSKILPSRIGMMLDLSSKDLDRVLRFERYIITKPGVTPLSKGQVLSEADLESARETYGDDFVAKMGAEALDDLLSSINLNTERDLIKEELSKKPQEIRRKKLIKRLNMISGFIKTGTRPEWMILKELPVMPADLRPLVALDAGRFATPDVNECYRKVLNRNNRLKELLSYDFPEIVIRNEKRMLQNSVDALIDNSRLDRPFVGTNGRPLQSIGDNVKGKSGRFRQNLLGKRVDYSGRSVITVGPHLKLHQCGLPRKMALELFKPFVFARLVQYGFATTLKSAKRFVEEQRAEVWDILKEVTFQHPVLLNRAPTLHRLGIQAFECILTKSSAIELHPLVCGAFNADFDGDQMSVHVPLSVEAQLEARILMMPTNNLISPAHGRPIMVPSKDIVLGIYHLTYSRKNLKGEGSYFNQAEIEKALDAKLVDLNAEINAYVDCPVDGSYLVKTTPGRLVLFNALPEGHLVPFSFVNKPLPNKDATALFSKVYKTTERSKAVEFADTLMQVGFKYATISGVSFSYNDLVVPPSKKEIIAKTWSKINEFKRQFNEGLITEGERKNKVTDAWYKCDELVGSQMEELISAQEHGKPMNAVYMMAQSGARGSAAQMRQVMAMRGFIAKTDGEILENAVDSNYAEGLSPHSYYLATHGTRKGFSDMALKTADAGYFTRKLVDVAQDCIITSKDCEDRTKTEQDYYDLRSSVTGMKSKSVKFDANTDAPGAEFAQAFGRVLALDVVNPANDEVLFEKGTLLREEHLEALSENSIISISLRSPITCSNEFGICSMCYGMDLSKHELVNLGEPVGVVAAQSIGEPGAQLTMRTFHSGGGARRSSSDSFISAVCDGTIEFRGVKLANKGQHSIMLSRYGEFKIIDSYGRERAQSRIPYGSKVFVQEGQTVKKGEHVCEWDQFIIPKVSEVSGTVHYVDLSEGVSLKTVIDESTNAASRLVIDWKKGTRKNTLTPSLTFKDEHGNDLALEDGSPLIIKLNPDDVIMVDDGDKINPGDILVKKQREAMLSGDITAGLPRLVEIFEARQPKVQATISEIDGNVTFGKDYRSKRCITVTSKDGSESAEYMISKDRILLVQSGDPVRKGDPLCDGDISSHDILRILGKEAVVLSLLNSIQNVFKSQGIGVDNKHIECIVRYMMRKVEIKEAGDSSFIVGEQIDSGHFLNSLQSVEGDMPSATPVLQGITRSASMDTSFIKAASFQEAHKVFVESALRGQIDNLNGMKQRIVTGMLIPAGTGFVHDDWIKKENKS